jgi:uncharacterized membrane-anchored protein
MDRRAKIQLRLQETVEGFLLEIGYRYVLPVPDTVAALDRLASMLEIQT